MSSAMRKMLAFWCIFGGFLATVGYAQTVTLNAMIGSWIDPNSPEVPQEVRDLYAQFAAEHPDIEINWDIQGYTQLQQKLLTSAAAGNLPDFAYVDSIWVQQLAGLGALQPLEGLWPAEDRADYKDAFIEGAMYDGALYAIWDSTDTRVLWYNTEIFKEAGLDPEKPPTTWEELLTAAQAITQTGHAGLGLALGPHEYLTADVVLPMFWGLGGELLDADGRPVFHEGDNLAAMTKVLTFLGTLKDDGVLPSDALQLQGGGALYPGMATEGYGMSIGNNNVLEVALKDLAPDTYAQWQVALLPAPTGGEPSSMNGGFTWAVMTADPAKQQAAWEFISFWNSPEVQLTRYKPNANVAVRKSTAQDPFYQSPYWQTVNEAVTVGRTRPGVALYPVMSQAIQNAVQQFLVGNSSAEDAVTAAGEAAVAEYEREQQR